MMARRAFGQGVMAALGGASALLLSGCGLISPTENLRYRLSVEVDTPQGLKTGSSVIAVRGAERPDWLPGSLGGGLVGYVGAVSGTQAITFDHRPFDFANDNERRNRRIVA